MDVIKKYDLRPIQLPYKKSYLNTTKMDRIVEKLLLLIGEQVIKKKPRRGDLKDFQIWKKEANVLGCISSWGITYTKETIGFLVVDDTNVSFVPGEELEGITIVLN